MSRSARVFKAGEGVYRLFLYVYPPTFRRRFGDELLQVCRTAEVDGSATRLRLVASLFAGGLRERWLCVQLRDLMPWSLAVLLALAIAWMDQRATEPQPAALALLLTGFALALWRPRGCWWRAFLLGSAIPVMGCIGAWLHPYVFSPSHPNPLTGFVAVIPAMIGAAGGRGLRWLLSQAD